MRKSSCSASRFVVVLAGVALAICTAAGAARADVSPALQKKLKGKLYLATAPFPLDGDGDAAVAKGIEKHAEATIKPTGEADGVASFHFALIAFMKTKPGVTELSVDFFTDDKAKVYSASKRLAGISADVSLLATELDLTEDDGLARGKSYVVDLTASVKGKQVVLATTRVKLAK